MMIRYEKFSEKHIPLYYEWRNNPEVAQYDQAGFLRPMAYEEVEAWSQRMVEGLTFVVYEDDLAIGTCAFMNVDTRNRHAELALVIGNPNYWGKGYGTQIMKQLLEWGFEGQNLHRLYLRVYRFNQRAIALYEKSGFIQEGLMREMVYREGKYHDVLIYGINQHEWIERIN